MSCLTVRAASAAAFLSILLAGYTSGALGLVLSTVLIVLFAEIVPQVRLASLCCLSLSSLVLAARGVISLSCGLQAISSRHGLLLGAKTVWLIRGCMIILAPLAWPLAFILDKACPLKHPPPTSCPSQALQLVRLSGALHA